LAGEQLDSLSLEAFSVEFLLQDNLTSQAKKVFPAHLLPCRN
jgi:hypothetical protein